MVQKKWFLTSELEERMKTVSENYQHGDLLKLANEFGIPPRKLGELFYEKMGVNANTFYRYKWSKQEILILQKFPKGTQLALIKEALISAGFENRSLKAISKKRSKIGFGLNPDINGHLTANAVAEGLGVDRGTVVSWIKRGWLRAYRPTGPTIDISAAYTITPEALREFIIEYVAYLGSCWPKMDRYFIVDILSGKSFERRIFEKRMEG